MLNLADAEASTPTRPISPKRRSLVTPTTTHLEAAFRQLFPVKA